MDFNPLDLLASTALRDNRNTQPSATSSDLKLVQPDDTDAEEEDGEADGNVDTGAVDDSSDSVATAGGVMPCSGCDLEDDSAMGSMKSGKDKKTLGKSVAIVTGDSIRADQKPQTEDKQTTALVIAEKVGSHWGKLAAQNLESGNESSEVDGADKGTMCNGGDTHSPVVQEPEAKLCNGKIPLTLDSISAVKYSSPRKDACEYDTVQAANTVAEDVRCEQWDKCEDTTSCSCQGEAADSPVSEQPVSDVPCGSQSVSSDSVSMETQAVFSKDPDSEPASATEESVVNSDSDCKTDQDLQVTAGLQSNCDENCTSSVTVLPHCTTETEPSVKIECASDQVCEVSGNKELHSPPSSYPPANFISASSVVLDHSYAAPQDKPLHRPSSDTPDDSGDAFESADENNSADDIEHRSRSLSVDSEYLHYGVPGTPHELEHISQTDKGSLMSPTPSVDSVSNDSSVSENSNNVGQFYSILVPGSTHQTVFSSASTQKLGAGEGLGTVLEHLSSESAKYYNSGSVEGCPGPAPKCGKFRIGTFASFSSSNLELDREVAAAADMKERRLKIGIPPEPGMKSSMSSPALASPGSPFPLLQSPGIEWDRSDAGSEILDDLDSSTTDDKYLSSSHGSDMSGITTLVWNHPVFHDHDYCCKETSERLFGKPVAEVRPMKQGKRKYTKKKDREIDDDKIKKGKYLKRELLKQDNRFSLPSSIDSKPVPLRTSVQSEHVGTRPVGRPRKRLDSRPAESDIDPETGAKMKITGKFQDQYVYYLSKTSRNRRRKLPEGPPAPPSDKIILPAPKPGDIVVPHLTDADIEAIKHGGRAALKRNGTTGYQSQLSLPQQDHVDMDSNIVNTILSMESDNLGSPIPAQPPDMADPMGLYSEQPASDGLGFMGENMNLTPDQVDLLLSVVKDVEVQGYSAMEQADSKLATSQPLDFLTSADTAHMGSPALDTMAATTVDKDVLGAGIPPSSSQNSSSVLGTTAVAPVDTRPDISANIKQEPKLPDSHSTVFSGGIAVPSFDKTLEFLKGDFKPDFFQEPPVSQAAGNISTPENDTPWIVTVTIYWNDIPAIIINNQPYVRLVDIHKQILPAKDTGILKKRCQLMNIPVLNCSDMQRYFLVQYGRAYNSKSTLVITKDQARELIGYYVVPQPRGMRSEDGGGAGLKRSSSCMELGSYSDSSVHQHPPPFSSPRRRGGFRRKAVPSQSQNSSPGPGSPVQPVAEPSPLVASTPVPDSPSKRLRHKKINFLEMLKGEDSASSSPATPSADSSRSEESFGDGYGLEHSPPRGASKASIGHKRRRSKEFSPEAPRGRRGSKGGGSRERKRSSEAKTVSPKGADIKKASSSSVAVEAPEDSEIMVVVDAQTDVVKAKKRSPGLSSAAVSTSPPGRMKASKFRPLKVKLKGLLNFGGAAKSKQAKKKNLFGRKGPVQAAVGRSQHVLKVAHQDVNADQLGGEAMSQIAEIHLDLYKRRLSPCVKCWTCQKFMSVPGFLQHQHADASSQQLVDVKRLQVLVPINKENVSVEEKRLWSEFVALQKRLDRSPGSASSMAQPLQPSPFQAAELSVSSPVDQHCVVQPASDGGREQNAGFAITQAVNVDRHTADTNSFSVTSPPADVHVDCEAGTDVAVDVQSDDVTTLSGEQFISSSLSHPYPSPHPSLPTPPTPTHEEKWSDSVVTEKVILKNTSPSKQPHQRRHHRVATPLNVRTSSRKRKEKQFFSIENYSFNRKSAKHDVDHREVGGDVTVENTENEKVMLTLSNGPDTPSLLTPSPQYDGTH